MSLALKTYRKRFLLTPFLKFNNFSIRDYDTDIFSFVRAWCRLMTTDDNAYDNNDNNKKHNLISVSLQCEGFDKGVSLK
jgi:hypothetical protein